MRPFLRRCLRRCDSGTRGGVRQVGASQDDQRKSESADRHRHAHARLRICLSSLSLSFYHLSFVCLQVLHLLPSPLRYALVFFSQLSLFVSSSGSFPFVPHSALCTPHVRSLSPGQLQSRFKFSPTTGTHTHTHTNAHAHTREIATAATTNNNQKPLFTARDQQAETACNSSCAVFSFFRFGLLRAPSLRCSAPTSARNVNSTDV